jgi:hypothetical protein
LNLDSSNFIDIPSEIRWQYLFYDTTWIRNSIHLQGDVETKSNSTILPYDQFKVGRLDISNATGTINESSIQSSVLQGIIVNNLVLEGSVHSTINSNDLSLIPTNYGSYGALQLEPNFNISLYAQEGAAIRFSVITSTHETYEINLFSGTVVMENVTRNNAIDNKTLIYERTNACLVNGVANFADAYIPNYVSLPNNISYVYGYPVLINGTTHFNSICSSDNVILLSDFGYSGNFSTNREASTISLSYWEITAPWVNVLSYPLFLIITTFLLILSIVFIRLRRKNKNY